jgi:hypothetical protein
MKAWHRHYHSPWKRGLHAFVLVAVVMIVGTAGMHLLEHLSYLDAFYFMSMLATAQGPMLVPATTAGKLFTALMAFISVGTVVAALGYLFGPFFTQAWKLSVRKIEEEEHMLADKMKGHKPPGR